MKPTIISTENQRKEILDMFYSRMDRLKDISSDKLEKIEKNNQEYLKQELKGLKNYLSKKLGNYLGRDICLDEENITYNPNEIRMRFSENINDYIYGFRINTYVLKNSRKYSEFINCLESIKNQDCFGSKIVDNGIDLEPNYKEKSNLGKKTYFAYFISREN